MDILPEKEQVLTSVNLLGGKILAEYLEDAKSVLRAYSYIGDVLGEVMLPGIGSIGSISGSKDDEEAFLIFTNFTQPATIYSLNTTSLSSKPFKTPRLDFDSNQYTTEQRFCQSKDGTMVPLFITYKKDLSFDGKNPSILYGYGGFDISLTPALSIPALVLLENGGVYAVANLRGGGEYGKKWHQAGTKEKKQNVFDDFHAAAEFLIEHKYTGSDKLAIMGGSNGGLLVGACMTQRPDLYKVAIPRVGVLDMLRYHKFTIGWAWSEDYGLSDDPGAFKYLMEYSPLHNIREVEYPATFIMTADHDDRVVPAHSFKFAAEMQSKQLGTNPVLIRIEESAGHGAGKPTSKLIDENADMLSFTFFNMNEEVSYKKLDK
jgi:prolyl oligopeptidase